MLSLKKGSQVKVISGKDKGKTGEILEINRSSNRVKIKAINIIKKHLKPTKENKGGIISKENFIHISNIKNVEHSINNLEFDIQPNLYQDGRKWPKRTLLSVGVLGVLGGLEIIRTLNDLDIKTKHPIEIVNWTNEEGTRFAPPMLSSGVFASMHTEEWAYNREDSEGKKFGDELKRIGWRGEEPVGERKLHAFYELHIEQGPILEDENVDIGVVTHGQGLNWLQLTLVGKESHTGSTPMPKRVNAGLGMARITQLVDEIALSHAPHAVGAIGHIDVYPNSRNIIPGKVVFTVDFRHPNKEVIQDMEDRMRKGAADIAEKIGLTMDIEKVGNFDPVEFDKDCVEKVRDAAKTLGYSHMNIVSGAGHDACWINRVAPTAMIMCPCVDGLSHNEAEEITKEWSTAGADVLFHAVVNTAEITE